MVSGVSILSGPARYSFPGSTRLGSVPFRLRVFGIASRYQSFQSASPAASEWATEAIRVRLLKIQDESSAKKLESVHNVSHTFDKGIEYHKTKMPQIGIFRDGFMKKPQELLANAPKAYQIIVEENKQVNDTDSLRVREKCKLTTTNKQQTPTEKLIGIYDKVFLVDNVLKARKVVKMLKTKYRDHIFACDTEVANIDVKEETPVSHGEIICFSIYCGSQATFGDGKSCIWVDVLDGGKDVLMEFAPFFEDQSIKKVVSRFYLRLRFHIS